MGRGKGSQPRDKLGIHPSMPIDQSFISSRHAYQHGEDNADFLNRHLGGSVASAKCLGTAYRVSR